MDVKFKKYLLKNGIKAIIIPLDTKLTYISTSISTGFNNETEKTRHVTHYYEHLLARFMSRKFKDVKYIDKELANRGAKKNAYVNNNETCVYIEGKYDDLGFFMDIISSTFKKFYFNKNLALREKKAVLQEIDNIIAKGNYEFNLRIFKYLYPKYGNIEDFGKHIKNVKRFTDKDIKSFIKNNLCSKNIVVTITCPKNKIRDAHKNLIKYFGTIKNKNKCNNMFPILQHNNKSFKVVGIKNNINKNNIIRLYLCKDIEHNSREHFMLLVIYDILFNFNSGVFYKKLRDELGLIYSMGFNVNIDIINKKSSYIYISTKSNFKNLPIIIKELINILNTYKITETDIKIAKNINQIEYENLKFRNLSSFNYRYKKHLLFNKKFVSNKEGYNIINSFTFKEISEYYDKLRNDMLKRGIIFYYSKKNLNKSIDNNLKKTIIKNNYKLLYI